MKYYDKSGGQHRNIFSAMIKNATINADTFIMNKMPGYEATIHENEHLYDATPIRFDEYPPKTNESTVQSIVVHQTGIDETPNTDDKSSSEKMFDTLLETMGIAVEPSVAPVYNNSDPSVQDLLKMDHEEPIPSLQKINIDYAHGVINLHDEFGHVIASSPIDERLSKGTIDKALLDILYPEGNVPEHVTSDIQSKGQMPGHASKPSHPVSNEGVIVTPAPEDNPSCG